MFSLIHGLWKYFWKKEEFCIVLLGLDNAGKTTFLERTKTKFNHSYKANNIDKITSTVGLNIGNIDAQGVRIIFWDLGGQGTLQLLWDKYYSECHGIIYVIDSSDNSRIEESKDAFSKVLQNDQLEGVPLLIVANKADIPDHLSLNRIQNIFEPVLNSSRAKSRDVHCVQVSALKGEGIDDSINWLISCIKRNSFARPSRSNDE